MKEAAGTSYTFYITNQDDERIIGNLQFYRDQEGVVEADFVDLERRPYQVSYTVMTLSFQTDRSRQTVQTQIRLLLEEQSDQGLHCFLFHLRLFDKIP